LLWLFGSLTLLTGSEYPLYLAVLGIGDSALNPIGSTLILSSGLSSDWWPALLDTASAHGA
jgi:hypothetical protein